MAKLRDLRDPIAAGKTAKLRLGSNHPRNEEKRDLTISIFKDTVEGKYHRKLTFSGESLPIIRSPFFTWKALFDYEDGIEAESDEWTIE